MIELAPTTEGTFGMGFAGDTFNTAWYARRLADPVVEVAYLSAIGDDAPSENMRSFIETAGITPELTVRKGMSVGLYMISLQDGERSFSYWRSTSAARTLADGLDDLPALQAGDIAFFSGITLAILPEQGRERLLSTLTKVRQRGVTVAFDPNLRPRLWPDTDTMCASIMEAASVADISLPSFEDEQGFFGDQNIQATAARYADGGASLVIVKDGAGPVLVRQQSQDHMVATEPATDIVDTTAAGDSFNAGFLVGHMNGLAATDATREGCALARKVIAARGALVEV